MTPGPGPDPDPRPPARAPFAPREAPSGGRRVQALWPAGPDPPPPRTRPPRPRTPPTLATPTLATPLTLATPTPPTRCARRWRRCPRCGAARTSTSCGTPRAAAPSCRCFPPSPPPFRRFCPSLWVLMPLSPAGDAARGGTVVQANVIMDPTMRVLQVMIPPLPTSPRIDTQTPPTPTPHRPAS